MESSKKVKEDKLVVIGAREHNLQNISVTIPRNAFVVITGLSGSGKSSLAFDTIYAEGQRRFIETLSPYARRFVGDIQRPAVDKITGLSPVISIEQKTISYSPRSTVGTITEVYDYLRLLYARVSTAYSYITNEPMIKYTENQIIDLIKEKYKGMQIVLFAPLVRGRKGHHREIFEQVRRWGFIRVRIDGEVKDVYERLQVDRYKIHNIEVEIDKLEVGRQSEKRLVNSIKTALQYGKGTLMVMTAEDSKITNYSRHLMCPTSGISYLDPEPNIFSFNSPFGSCPHCHGLGYVTEVDLNKMIPNPKKSIRKGGIEPLGEYKPTWIFKQIEAMSQRYNFSLDDPIEELPESALNMIFYGTEDPLMMKNDVTGTMMYSSNFEGIINFIKQNVDDNSATIRKWAAQFMHTKVCGECQGGRLKKESTFFRIGGKSIVDLAAMDIADLHKWMSGINRYFNDQQKEIAREIVKGITERLSFLIDLGVDYLTLNRPSQTLSGGEAQRIRLATQIGSKLANVLYILDEPSIGLHQRDNQKLINSLQKLKKNSNSIIVVEHDYDTMKAADYIVDIGPAAGINGGKVVAQGTFEEICQSNSLTGDYLAGRRKIEVPAKVRKPNGSFITLKGASGNNLKNITVQFPLGVFICVTGVSGSGKSTLINNTLYPILNRYVYRSDNKILPYESIEGMENIDKVIEINQQPIGRTPRSNPITYIGVFDEIRKLYAELPESRVRNYKAGRFSFNVSGGRCETCKGAGVKTVEMGFLPEVYIHCEACNGKRFNRETLEVRYKGKSINDVLEMTFQEAYVFFSSIPHIAERLKTVVDVGLGYLHLGQTSTTLSGGEAQRIKLSAELSKKETGKTFYILDEPTTGLHFEDIRILLNVLNQLVDKGNTVLVIEHNMDVIKTADWIIDMGPEGGKKGGEILFEGPPSKMATSKKGYTAQFLKNYL
ncbi:MAG: excinuclease ABC subunit UvrA [Bacteroidales bacterium]|nr:excinuclease ABC subunit UvrA [Bacteroidales bacterium]